MSSADLTHYVLTVSVKNQRTYTAGTIKGIIQSGGGNVGGLPIGNFAKYAYTLFTRASATIGGAAGTIKEGDRVADSNSRVFDVLHVDKVMWLNNFSHYVCELLFVKTVAYVFKRTYGTSRDPNTGWLPITETAYANVMLNYSVSGAAGIQTPIGTYGKYDLVAVTSATVLNPTSTYYNYIDVGDVVWEVDPAINTSTINNTFEVTAAIPYPTQNASDSPNSRIFTVLYLTRNDRASTTNLSDTWHTDTISLKTDPRYRTKLWLDTYMDTANILISAGHNAPFAVIFANPKYPLLYEFTGVGSNYALITVDAAQSTPRVGHDKRPYAFDETIPITVYAVNDTTPSTGGLAERLVEQVEQEIRRIATLYPFGSIRQITRTGYKTEYLGKTKLLSSTLEMTYTRSNHTYTPSYPTVTWGPSTSATGTYTFPNVTRLEVSSLSNNQKLTAPGRLGQITQKLGLPSWVIQISCDLDMEPWSGGGSDTRISWQRPQTNGVKTDVAKEQVFYDIQFNGQVDQAYQTMSLGYGGTLPVVLDEVHVVKTGDSQTLDLTFYGYNAASASAYKTFYGINP